MSKGWLIFGAGQVAQVFGERLNRWPFSISAHIVDAAHWQPNEWVHGRPVVAFEQVGVVTFTPPDDYYFIVGMSFKGLNAARAEKYQAMIDKGYRPLTFVDPAAISRGAVGPGSFVMELNNIQHGAEIGKNCVLWAGNHIGHHTKIGDHTWISSHAVIGGACEIGERCFIGVNATIRDGVKIGPRCVIGAGALILSDCEADGVYGVTGTERSRVPSSRLRSI